MHLASQSAGNPGPERRDFRKEVTESIIRMLEQGVAPWQKPLDAETVGRLAGPFNPTSNNPYRGGNAIYLMAPAIRKGYDDPRWMTYKQAAANDWQVRNPGLSIAFTPYSTPDILIEFRAGAEGSFRFRRRRNRRADPSELGRGDYTRSGRPRVLFAFNRLHPSSAPRVVSRCAGLLRHHSPRTGT